MCRRVKDKKERKTDKDGKGRKASKKKGRPRALVTDSPDGFVHLLVCWRSKGKCWKAHLTVYSESQGTLCKEVTNTHVYTECVSPWKRPTGKLTGQAGCPDSPDS